MASPTTNMTIPPVFEYLLFGTIGLLCLAITIGIVILLRRHSTRDQMTGLGEIDYPKIAAQLQKEIRRLQDLRDRIYPEGAADAAIADAARAPSEPQVGGLIQGSSLASMSSEDLLEMPEVKSIIETKVKELAKVHEEEISKVKESSGTSKADDSKLIEKENEISSLKQEVESLKASLQKASESVPAGDQEVAKKLETEMQGLKERLQEYEIFEDDLSRVKELKEEIESLKKQLSSGSATQVVASVAAASTLVSEVAATSSENRTSSPETAKQEVSEEMFEAAVESESSASLFAPEESEETSANQITAEFEKLLAGSGPSVTVETKTENVASKDFEVEKTSSGPEVLAVSPAENTQPGEAIAGDDLMAEFEKLLGSVDKV